MSMVKRLRSSRSLVVTLGALLLLAGLAVVGVVGKGQPASVVYTKPRVSGLSRTLRATGVIIPERDIDVRSRIAGTVANAPFETGDFVKSSETLVSFDDSQALARREQAKANVNQAMASDRQAQADIKRAAAALDLAQIRLDNARVASDTAAREQVRQAELELKSSNEDVSRLTKLVAGEVAEKVELQKAVDQRDIIASRLALAQAQLAERRLAINREIQEAAQAVKQAEASYQAAVETAHLAREAVTAAEAAYRVEEVVLKEYRVSAPMEGIILEKAVDSGEFVQPGQLLYRMASRSLMAAITPDERELANLPIGREGVLAPEAYPEVLLPVRIFKRSAAIDADRSTVTVYLELLETSEVLLPNMSVSVEIPIPQNKKLLALPSEYVVSRDGGEYVFLFRNEQAVIYPVTVGGRSGSLAYIQSGLDPDDIVLHPDNLSEGTTVQLKEQ